MDSTHSSSDHDDGGWEGASESTEATASCSSTGLRPAASRGKRKRSCKWSADWKRYRMTPSKKGATYVYCTLCQTDISIASGGVYDVILNVCVLQFFFMSCKNNQDFQFKKIHWLASMLID